MPLFNVEKLSIPTNLLKDKYIVPPFSIINTITQDWQRRKDRWENLGLESAEGRNTKLHNATPSNTFSARGTDVKKPESVSTFDPALAELLIKWFSNEGDEVLDPFAGGSVRGIISTVLNRKYTGIDISKNQVNENINQYREMLTKYAELPDVVGAPVWFCADSMTVESLIPDNSMDMLFTCPPYYNREIYSDNPSDLSNLKSYEEFLFRYRKIIQDSCKKLKENSFAVIVVSEIRNDATGNYYGFVPDTINAFRDAGMNYYNEIILENNIGSLPIRAGKYFDQSRKIGRHHQNILVFYKGNTKTIENKYGKFSVSSI